MLGIYHIILSYNFRLPQCRVVKFVFILNHDLTIEKNQTFATFKIAKKSFDIVVVQTTQK